MADNFDFLTQHLDDLDGTLIADMRDEDGDRNNVLENSQANSIRVRWELNGALITANVLTGSWELQAQLERIGGGAEFAVPAAPIVIPWNSTGLYTQSIPVPAGTVPAGAYKVVVLLSHLNAAGTPTRMAGFVEIPMVRFI